MRTPKTVPPVKRTDITDITEKCTNCGNCRVICPDFKYKKEESHSTRGRISLIKGLYLNELNNTKLLSDKIFSCLNCGQCSKYCPADVDYKTLIKLSRSRLSRNSYIKRFVLSGLFSSDKTRSEFFFKCLRKALVLFYSKPAVRFFRYGLLKLLRLPGDSVFPQISEKDFFSLGIRNKLSSYKGFRIALFTGCGGKYLYPETTDRFVRILRHSGIQVIIPKNQVCCGNPLENAGILKQSSGNIKINTACYNSLKDIRCIVSLCGRAMNSLTGRRYSEKIRLPLKSWAELFFEENIRIKPLYKSSVIFHLCPKCGSADHYIKLLNTAYTEDDKKPEMITEFCGSTELMDRSNMAVRDSVTGAFFLNNSLENYTHIACVSFECVEHLNSFFIRKNANIRALHFIDAFDL